MAFKTIALAAVALALAAAPAEAARERGPVSTGSISGTRVDGIISAPPPPAPVVGASEPLTLLAVGLGLLGVGLLRRRS